MAIKPCFPLQPVRLSHKNLLKKPAFTSFRCLASEDRVHIASYHEKHATKTIEEKQAWQPIDTAFTKHQNLANSVAIFSGSNAKRRGTIIGNFTGAISPIHLNRPEDSANRILHRLSIRLPARITGAPLTIATSAQYRRDYQASRMKDHVAHNTGIVRN